MTVASEEYFFIESGAFLIPAEHYSHEGLSAPFKEVLVRRELVSVEWVELFERSFAEYWRRLVELEQVAPEDWFPPRVLNACIVTDPKRCNPFYPPFFRTSWLFFHSDFEPQGSNPAFGSFLFAFGERLNVVGEIGPALLQNLTWFLTMKDDEVAQFVSACEQSTRPDGDAWRALAKRMPAVRRLYHATLNRPVISQRLNQIPNTSLLAPAGAEEEIGTILKGWRNALDRTRGQHFEKFQAKPEGKPLRELIEWLESENPRIVFTGKDEEVLWAPTEPDTGAIRAELSPLSDCLVESMHKDLHVVADRSALFLDSLVDVDALPKPASFIEPGGLSYIHGGHMLIAYSLYEGAASRTKEPSRLYERLMLAARTVHEWGHLVAHGKWVAVPEEKQSTHKSLSDELSGVWEEVVAAAPADVADELRRGAAKLAKKHGSVHEGLAKSMRLRFDDFLSNYTAVHYLHPFEMETYVRHNVRALTFEYSFEFSWQQLARYAYEYQYLRFSGIEDPWDYFLKVSWFAHEFLEMELVPQSIAERLFQLTSDIYDCYAFDETKMKPPERLPELKAIS